MADNFLFSLLCSLYYFFCWL